MNEIRQEIVVPNNNKSTKQGKWKIRIILNLRTVAKKFSDPWQNYFAWQNLKFVDQITKWIIVETQ